MALRKPILNGPIKAYDELQTEYLNGIGYELIQTGARKIKKYDNGLIEMYFHVDISVPSGNQTVFTNLPHNIVNPENGILIVQRRAVYNNFNDISIYGSAFSGQTVGIALNNKTGSAKTERFFVIAIANWK